ncbi:hypothetical protein A6R68_05657, partial [Neotoma lepida]
MQHAKGVIRTIAYLETTTTKSHFDVYVGHAPVGTSVQTLLHYSQGIRTGIFQAYDLGSPFLNMLHYGQPTPPQYKIKDMKVPTAMWSGEEDFLANPIDVKQLVADIPNLVYHKKIADYNHMDFVIGLDAPKRVFNEI